MVYGLGVVVVCVGRGDSGLGLKSGRPSLTCDIGGCFEWVGKWLTPGGLLAGFPVGLLPGFWLGLTGGFGVGFSGALVNGLSVDLIVGGTGLLTGLSGVLGVALSIGLSTGFTCGFSLIFSAGLVACGFS